MNEHNLIDIGRPGAWNIDGLVRVDTEARRLARHYAETIHGAETIRWYLLDLLTEPPVPAPFESFKALVGRGDHSPPLLFLKRLFSQKAHLDDEEVGELIGYATDSPIKRREWRNLRDVVFARIGLEFGPPPTPEVQRASTFDIGTAPDWRYDVIRALDKKLIQLAEHHAATDVGARTIRWYIWHELTARPRPVELSEIEKQLESAEVSLMSSFSDEIRRSRGHLDDNEVALMVGFRNKRPVMEGYYRQLREDVFGRVARGFGAVDLPELHLTAGAFEIGRQGAWKKENLTRLDKELTRLAGAYAKTSNGAQTLRWHLLDRITEDPAPVDLMLIEQRLQKLGASVLDLFGVLDRRKTKKQRPFLGDAKIARFAKLDDPTEVEQQAWQEIRERVLERVDIDGVFEDA